MAEVHVLSNILSRYFIFTEMIHRFIFCYSNLSGNLRTISTSSLLGTFFDSGSAVLRKTFTPLTHPPPKNWTRNELSKCFVIASYQHTFFSNLLTFSYFFRIQHNFSTFCTLSHTFSAFSTLFHTFSAFSTLFQTFSVLSILSNTFLAFSTLSHTYSAFSTL